VHVFALLKSGRKATLLSLLIMAANTACEVQTQSLTGFQGCATRVVFDSERNGESEMYVLDILSGDVARLTQHSSGAANRFPDFAPGGQFIVFVSQGEQRTGQLFIMRSNGEGLRQLTTDEAEYENPAWSPSGDWIAFEMEWQGVWGLYLIRPDGSNLHRIGPDGVNLFHPSWSPDQSRIAVVTGNEEAWVVGILDLSTGAVDRLSEPGLDIGSVKWSPDGSRLALDAVSGSNFDLYLLDLETGELRRLTENPAIDARPDWSPDGSQLVFNSTRDQGGSSAGQEQWDEFELYVFDLESGGIERLTNNSWFDAHPDWCTPEVHGQTFATGRHNSIGLRNSASESGPGQ
jgi:Tol biopolymer transport system component